VSRRGGRTIAMAAIIAAFTGGRADPAEPAVGPPNQVVDGIGLWRDLQYSDGPSKNLTLDLAMTSPANSPRGAVVLIHGGGWIEGDKSSFSTVERRAPANILDLAKLGFVSVTINYRLAGEAPYPAALDDCRAAIAWLRARAKPLSLDPDRIGVWGNSAGGHLALLLAASEREDATGAKSPLVQAAVSDSGPLDLVYQAEHNQLRTVVERFLGGPLDEVRRAAYREASPSAHASDKLPPLLLIYGARDEQVDVRTADEFVVALSRARHGDVTYLRLATAGHCPHSLVGVPLARTAVHDFFLRILAPAESGKK
jgi:acetyl esterase/lipase